MDTNGIIFIDSSDDDIPCKIRKIDSNQLSSDSQEELDDVVIIDETTLNGHSASNGLQKECDVKLVKRIELTTLKDKHNIHVSTEVIKVVNGNNNKIESKDSNCDILNIESITVNKNPSTSSIEISQNKTCPEFEAFLEACSVCNCDIKYKNMILKKLSAIKCKYTDADETFVESKQFIKYLINRTEKVKQKPLDAIIVFNDVYRELESKKKREVNFTDREERHLQKLNKALKKVHKKIKCLENEEVNFEDDSNSSYIMLERYKERLCTIQKKICSFTKENFYSGRYLFKSLDFTSSKYPEINRAIDKLYSKKKQFPSYYEVNQCIRKCVEQNNLSLSEDALINEVRLVFTAMGNVLQRRRKLELYDSLTYFLEGAEGDPAENDPEFEAMLKGRQVENEKKIDDILQKFTDCQERNEEPEVSSDSDDSNHVSENSDS